MKQFLFSVAATLLISTQAYAIFIPGQERPRYQAKMLVSEASGTLSHEEFVYLVNFTVDDQSQAGFYLSLDEAQAKRLFVVSDHTIDCSSQEIVATDTISKAIQGNYLQLTVINHTNRLCTDLPANLIKVILEEFRAPYLEPVGTLKATGTTEVIYMIQ